MSLRYKGAVISATPPTTTGGNSGTAPGAWTLQQQLQAQGAGNWPNQPIWYVEDVFSTWLYTGNGATQTITNGINLSTYGGLVWMKARNGGSIPNYLIDTSAYLVLNSNSTSAGGSGYYPTYFNPTSSGFFIDESAGWFVNTASTNFASWTFRKQPKFFDVVTYTGDGTGLSRQIAHSLGSAPGCIIIKRTDAAQNWKVYHRSLGNNYLIELNITDAANNQGTQVWNSQATYFSTLNYNASGGTYVAYLFAHNAGGFGLTGTDNVISCGSFSCSPSGTATVTLGYEPQWILAKDAANAGSWELLDVMRGMNYTATEELVANTSGASYTYNPGVVIPTATGFTVTSSSPFGTSSNIIYIAIRRGPMKTPTSGTSVFSPIAYAGDSTTYTSVRNLTTNFAGDMVWIDSRNVAGQSTQSFDKLRGSGAVLYTAYTYAEEQFNSPSNYPGESVTFNNTQTVLTGSLTGQGLYNYSGYNYVAWNFRRAPGFFDEVCYTGTGATPQNITHNLGVAPELIIVKARSDIRAWGVYHKDVGAGYYLLLNTTDAPTANVNAWNNTTPTASVFSVGNSNLTNNNISGGQNVAYLFASCPGVSKVGSYSGTGATQTIDCGFTGGARWVLIKRTDSTGDWYVWDTARGMVSGTDPSLLLNSTAAEVNANSVYTTSVGFQIVSTAAGINASGGSYIYLAIA